MGGIVAADTEDAANREAGIGAGDFDADDGRRLEDPVGRGLFLLAFR
jgi:hypothetical protein